MAPHSLHCNCDQLLTCKRAKQGVGGSKCTSKITTRVMSGVIDALDMTCMIFL
jgi:hypothetical protein